METLQYSPQPGSEFSSIISSEHTIHHQKGAYMLSDGNKQFIPVNRAYYLDDLGTRIFPARTLRYSKNQVIHEKIPLGINFHSSETIINIFGSNLLFLYNQPELTKINASSEKNPLISQAAKDLIETLLDSLRDLSPETNNTQLSVHGSHLIGIDGPDSDIDLIAWVNLSHRSLFLRSLNEVLRSSGYLDVNITSKQTEYLSRYMQRFSISPTAATYISQQRHRWIHPQKPAMSMQCLSSIWDHSTLSDFFSASQASFEANSYNGVCEVIDDSHSNNYPKVWHVKLDGKHLPIVSFSWTHQGMGQIDDSNSRLFSYKGIILNTPNGDFGYLKNEEHYLLPNSLFV